MVFCQQQFVYNNLRIMDVSQTVHGEIKNMTKSQQISIWFAALLGVAVVLAGCQLWESPGKKSGAKLKREITQTLDKFSAPLAGPLAQGDNQAVSRVLEQQFAEARQEGKTWLSAVGCLDRDGKVVARIPVAAPPGEGVIGQDYQDYQSVSQSFKEQRTLQARLFDPNGTKYYVVQKPLVKQGKVQGLLFLRLEASTVEQEWGMSEKQFLSMDLGK